ncbi:methyltransferase [Dactylosporangium sp. NPDC051485]|uniref:methyltransferase n=1 Tax=Dactylosporangium sp. NPDC051485 TaxID=3154846 RepID=UPI00342E6454
MATGRRSPGRDRFRDRTVAPARPSRRAEPRGNRVELLFLPGLEAIVRDEAAQRLPNLRRLERVPGRDDSLAGELSGALVDTARLRTVVAAFLVLSYPVPNPKALLGGEHMPGILAGVRSVVALNRNDAPRSLRIEAAGSDSPVLRKLAEQLAAGTGLRHDPQGGDCVVRVRPTPEGRGWDVLVRLSTRPLSARRWRVEGHPAAANATVAAAIARLSRPDPAQRVVNLMCGSGTLLIERLLVAGARTAVGFDVDADAVAAAAQNIAAAGMRERVRLLTADIGADEWLAGGPYDVLLADPPWGDKAGRHEESETLHQLLLDRARAGAAPGARLVVLTHEIRIMQRCLDRARDAWRLGAEIRVFHKGHHPRMYVLDRVAPAR